MPIVKDQWGQDRRVCESCGEDATWCTPPGYGSQSYYCDIHAAWKGTCYQLRKLEVIRMLEGKAFLVIPVNLRVEETDDYDEAMDIAGALATRDGGAIICAMVEKVRPQYNVSSRRSQLGDAIVRAVEAKRHTALPRPSSLDELHEAETAPRATDSRTRCMAHHWHPAGKEVQCERPEGHKGSHFNEDFQRSPITWHEVTTSHVTSVPPTPVGEVGTGETGGATTPSSEPVRDMPDSEGPPTTR